MHFTSTDFEHLEVASRTLLAPLTVPDVDTWRREAMTAVRALLGARRATFALPGTSGPYFLGDEVDAEIVDGIDTFLGPVWSGSGPSPSPPVDAFHQAVVSMGLTAWDFPLINQVMQGGATQFDYYHEVMVPGRITDTHTLFLPTPAGSVMLEVHDLQRPIGDGEALPLLRALVPSLKAGVAALQTLASRHAALAATLDGLDQPVAAYDADGRECHRNTALVRILGADPAARDIEDALGRAAWALRRLAFPRSSEGHARIGEAVAAEVTTPRGRYTFVPTVLPDGVLGTGGAYLITIRADLHAVFPSTDVLRQRFGLTAREAEVALLVAEGHANAVIADRLFVAMGTVKRHVESVLAKLEVPSRAAVAACLMRP